MERMSRTTYLWPGVFQLCHHGAWPFLAVAVLFGLLLNTAVLSTFVWSELFSPGIRNLTWLVVAVSWVGSALFSRHWNQRQQAPPETGPAGTGPSDDRFRAAQEHYLQGDWFEAERLLSGLIRRNPRDVDARLMLATLLRHTGRVNEAAQHLNWLQRLEGAAKWELEICREWELLQEARTAAAEGATPPSEASSEASADPATVPVQDAA